MLLLCTLVYAFFVVIDFVPIVKSKRWKLCAVYAVLFVTAYILSILNDIGVKIPSPAVPLKQLVTAVVGS